MLLNTFHSFLASLKSRRPWTHLKHRKQNRFHWKRTSSTGIAALESLEQRTLLSSTSFIYTPGGYLSEPSTADAETIARTYLTAHPETLGVTSSDVTDLILTDRTPGSQGRTTSLYFQQTWQGIPIDAATANVTVDSQGRILSIGNRLVANVATKVIAGGASLSAAQALHASANDLETAPPQGVSLIDTSTVYDNEVANFSGGNFSKDPIPVRQVYNLAPDGKLHLSWNAIVRMTSGADWFYINVDAQSGQELYRNNWNIKDDFGSPNEADSTNGALAGGPLGGSTGPASGSTPAGNSSPGSQFATGDTDSNLGTGSYNVYALPITDPLDGSRSLVNAPQDYRASPYGWHDTNGAAGAEFTTTQGNNVYAQEDADHNNSGGVRPDAGAGLNFDYPLDLSQSPTFGTNQSAEITQLFYTVNMLHDIHYRYGFDEASGNFQVNNYGKGGTANDQVNADAQDGGGFNNANFSTPVDGLSGRMQMYIWNQTNPTRDGDLSNDIIIHEFGHGVSNRLTGGPANSNALNAQQSGSMGEGWSDWWALMFTQRPTDTKLGSYSVANWVLGQTATGNGLRSYPYSYGMSVNPLTLGAYNNNPEVHAGGEIWTSVLWDLNWLYIDRYGYSNDLYDGTAGNNKLLQTVMDALKFQPALPSYLDARDAILAVDQTATGGANRDIIWQAFARRGFGVGAYDGGSASSLLVAENFDLPPDLASPTDDHSNSKNQATLVNSHSLTSGVIETQNDVDYFHFYADAGEHFDINVLLTTDNFTPLTDSTLTLYDTDGVTQLAFDDNSGGGNASYISFSAPSAGTYFLKVAGTNSTDVGPYVLSLLNDDHGNSAATASPTRFQSKQGGDFEVAGDVDYYSFTANAGQTINFQTFLISMPDTTLTLYSTDGTTQLAFNDNWNAANGQYFSGFGYNFGAAGTYYLKVASPANNRVGTYGLFIYNNGSDYDTVGNDKISASTTASPEVNAGLIINVPGDSEWVRYALQAGHKYHFNTVLTTLTDSTLTIYDHDGRTAVAFNDDNPVGDLESDLYFTPERTGFYYLRVGSYNDAGAGNVTLQSTATVPDDYSDIFQFATPVSIHSNTNGQLEVHDDADFFTFHAYAGLTYDLDNNRITLNDSLMSLIAPDGVTLINQDSGPTFGPGTNAHLSFTAAADGDYFVKINPAFSTSTGTYTLQINERNVAPVLDPAGSPVLPNLVEDVPSNSNPGMLVSDLINSMAPSGGITDQNVGDPRGIAIDEALNSNGTWQYSANDGASWNDIPGLLTDQAFLLPATPFWKLRFNPNLDFNGVRTISFYAWDLSSGIPGEVADVSQRGNETAFSNNSETATITVTPVNDAPFLNSLGNPKLPAITEDPADASNNGMLIKDLIANLRATTGTLSDVDTGALEGLAFTAADQTSGTWQFSTTLAVSWNNFGTTNASTARLLASDLNTRIRFVPNANYFGSSTVTFVAWDQTSGTNGNTAIATNRGGTKAFSLGIETASITITSVNDAPVLGGTGAATLTPIAEDTLDTGNTGTLVSQILTNFTSTGGTDVDDDAGALKGIAVTSVDNAHGTWEFTINNGTDWTPFGTPTASAARLLASVAGTKIRFRPAADYNGTATFQWVAWDQTAGTTNGNTGVATNRGGSKPYSTVVKSASITITPVNDAPLLGSTNLGIPSLTAIPKNIPDTSNPGTLISQIITNFTNTGGTFTDVDTGALKGIAVTSVDNTNGTWEFTINNGTDWTPFGSPTAATARLLASVAGTKMRFRPNAGFTGNATFVLVGWDQSTGTNGLTASATSRGLTKPFSLGVDTGTINVFNANTAPTFNTNGSPTLDNITKDIPDAGNTGTLVSQIIANLSATGGSITDPDPGALQGIAVTLVDNAHGTWQYTIDNGTNWLDFGSPAAATARLLASDANSRIRFKPAANYTGPATFLFVAWDQSSGVNGGTLSATTRGNATPFSTGYDTASISITP